MLSKMLNDPQYERGSQFIDSKVAEFFGASPRSVWPEFEKVITGPLVLAILPGQPQTPNDKNPPLRVVCLVQVNEPDVAPLVKQQWPVVSSMINSALRLITITSSLPGTKIEPIALTLLPVELKTIATGELPPATALPEWVAKAAWPKGDIVFRARPIQICTTIRGGPKAPQAPGEKARIPTGTIADYIEGSGVEAMAWGLAFTGDLMSERLVLDVGDDDSAFKKFTSAFKESTAVASWDGLMAATPGDVDAIFMMQSDLTKLGDDLPHFFESAERYFRGKRWSKTVGLTADALDPTRFKFLTTRLNGSFAVTAKPAITGELRLTVLSSVKTKPTEEKPDPLDPYKGNDTEKFRDELTKGLEATGAKFETLLGARKIGGALPLAAAFHGRGQFAAPVIGLSPGWAWLCSSSVAYQELTDAFKSGRTLAAREKRRNAPAAADVTLPGTPAAAPTPAAPNEWSAEDSIRADVNLDRVLKLGYAAWLLGNNEGPMIGNYKVPADLLPPPQVFGRTLGRMRLSANRTGNRLECRALCPFPGMSLVTLGVMQDASESITLGRRIAAEAAALKNLDDVPVLPKEDNTGKNSKKAPDKKSPPSAPSKEKELK